MSNIITAHFNNTEVFFQEDAYLNATAIAAHFNKKPIEWLRLPSTEEYIAALCEKAKVEKSHFVKTTRGGSDLSLRGTWLHRRLAVLFARWLNVDFAIWCDEQIEQILTSKDDPKLTNLNKTTVDDRTGLRNAITDLVNKKGLIYSEVYRLIHQQFNVEHIDELSQEQLSQAVRYIHFLTLNLSDVFKKGEEVSVPEYIFDAIMKHAKLAQKLAEKVIRYQEKQFALLGVDRHYRSNELTGSANSLLSDFSYFLREGEKLLAQQIENPKLTQTEKLPFNA